MDSQRDLLPFPLGAGLDEVLRGHAMPASSAGQQRRRREDRRIEGWLREGLACLNDMGGLGRTVPRDARLTAAQRDSVRRLVGLYATVPKADSKPSPQEAFKMLLGTRPGYADAATAGNRESYRRGAVSLPSSRAGQIGISTLLPPDLQNQLETGHGLLRTEGAVVAALEGCATPASWMRASRALAGTMATF